MIENKRELVELAAKAVGYEVVQYEGNGCVLVYDPDCTFKPKTTMLWLPLHVDGDAFRLAVKCGLLNLDDVLFYYGGTIDFQDDPYAATRLAIVRAAAEIGKAMP